MKSKAITFIFFLVAAGMAALSAVLAYQGEARHLPLGLAVAAAALSIATDPDFVLQDMRRILHPPPSANIRPAPLLTRVTLLLALVLLAIWLWLAILQG